MCNFLVICFCTLHKQSIDELSHHKCRTLFPSFIEKTYFFNRIFLNTWQLAITQGISKENLGKVANFTVYWNL